MATIKYIFFSKFVVLDNPYALKKTAFVNFQGRGIGDRMELSEAECDMDTMKNLKLGLRSSLWARPNSGTPNIGSGGGGGGLGGGGHPSDYSIAV